MSSLTERRPYSTDVTDHEWVLIEPMLSPRVTSLESDPVYCFRRLECSVTALNRRRIHASNESITAIAAACFAQLPKLHVANRDTKCPTNTRSKRCPLQDAIRAAGLSVTKEVKYAGMDVSD